MQKKQKVIQLNTELFKVTGIQRVIMDIHEALKGSFDASLMGTMPYSGVNPNLGIAEADYRRLRNPFSLLNSLVIIHERRLLPLMWLLTHIPGLNIKCLYVHHNNLFGHKALSLFPENIVAISDAGIQNLTGYFGVPRENITKIHNCVRDTLPETVSDDSRPFDPSRIRILYPARINSVKQQIDIVDRLRGKLDPRVSILFAGTGPLHSQLQPICEGDPQFQALGFRDDIPSLMDSSDFVMLYSKSEGLPISLIEACQRSTPVITNAVGGNPEIVENNRNGFIAGDWDSLLTILNSLPTLDAGKMQSMRQEGRKIYRERFTFPIFTAKYRELVSRILSPAQKQSKQHNRTLSNTIEQKND